MSTRTDRSALGWGTAFVVLGGWLAADELALVSSRPSAWAVAMLAAGVVLGMHTLVFVRRGWLVPAALVVVGSAFVLRDMGALTMVPVLPLVLIVVGVAILAAGMARRRGDPVQLASVALESAASARLTLDHGAGSVTLHGGADPGELLSGTFDGGVVHELARDRDHLDVRLRPATDRLWWRTNGLDWDVAVTEAIPVSLRLRTGAGQLRLDCSQLTVPRLELSTGASDVDLTLPAHGHTSVKIAAGAADVRVHVPAGVAASVTNRTGLAGVEIDPNRFPRRNGHHRSPDYDTVADRADIELDGGVASFSVD